MSRSRRLMAAGNPHPRWRRAGAAGGANLATILPFTHAYWTEGANFIAQGYSNGGAVATWPDEVGGNDLIAGWIVDTTGSTWQIFFGGTAGQNQASNTAKTEQVYFQSQSNTDGMWVNGVRKYGPGNYGTSQLLRMSLGNNGTHVATYRIAFLGVMVGNPIDHANRADFVAAINDLYDLGAV